MAAVVVPVAVIAVGTPVSVYVDGAVNRPPTVAQPTTSGTPAPEPDPVPDLDEQLAEAFRQADRLVPDGSASLQSIAFGRNRHVRVLDPRDGFRRGSTWDEDTGWRDDLPERATDLSTFSRDDLADLSLTAAGAQAARSS